MYLLFSSTYNQVPVASVVDMKIKENLEKGGSAKNVALWNWTPIQKSLLDADLPRVILTSYWSTGKTRILFVKALMLARNGKFVIFVLHYSQITEENKDGRDDKDLSSYSNFADHAPILLYHSLMNEIDKESKKNPQVKANIKLIVSKDLKEDILIKNAFDNSKLLERLSMSRISTFFTLQLCS